MSYETILYEKKERLATITLNRPGKFNTIKPPMPEELEKAMAEAGSSRNHFAGRRQSLLCRL
jgi:enoyl-CoA hydratase